MRFSTSLFLTLLLSFLFVGFTACGGGGGEGSVSTLYFSATDDVRGQELWSYNSSSGIVTLEANIFPGNSSNPGQLTAFGKSLYFYANDGTGDHLWMHNAFSGVTTCLSRNIRPGMSPSVDEIEAYGGRIYFTAQDATRDGELWMTNGTAPKEAPPSATSLFTTAVFTSAPPTAAQRVSNCGPTAPAREWPLWRPRSTPRGIPP